MFNFFKEEKPVKFKSRVEIHEVEIGPNCGFIYYLINHGPIYHNGLLKLCYWNCSHDEVQFYRGSTRKIPVGSWGTWLDSCLKISKKVKNRKKALKICRKKAKRASIMDNYELFENLIQ